MNIDKVVIKNFKNYIGEHHFNLNKKITIILGKNGFGKSSFFDAIEWCMTGRLNRFNRREFNPKDVLNYDDYGIDKECMVDIFFNGNRLKRIFKYQDGRLGNIKVTLKKIDGTIIKGQANIDDFLKNNYFRTTDESSEVFGDLIKHSHLLSQDQVTDFITKESPRDRFKSLAEIMGLKNVLYTIDNYNQIKNEADKRIDNFLKEKKNYNLLIKERRDDVTFVNHRRINTCLRELNIKEKFKDSFKSLEKTKKGFEESQYNLQREKKIYHKYFDMGYRSLKEINDKLYEINNQRKLTGEKVREVTKLKDDVFSLQKSLNDKSNKFNKLDNINSKIKQKKLLLKDNENQSLGESEITERIEIENQELQKIDYAKSYQKSYTDTSLFLKEYQSTKDELEKRSRFLHSRSERINSLLAKLNEKISEHDTGVTVKLMDHLKGILNFIEGDVQEIGRCPVCSVEHGDDLPNLVNANINHYKKLINNDTNLAEKLLSMKKRLVIRKENVIAHRESSINELESLGRKKENYQRQLDNIKANKLFTTNYIKLDKGELNQLSKEKKLIISSLDEAVSIKLEITKLNKQLNNFKKVIGTTTSTNNFRTRKSRLKRAEKRLQNLIVNKENKLKELDNRYLEIYNQYSVLEKLDTSLPLLSKIQLLDEQLVKIQKKLAIIDELMDYKQILGFNKKVGKDIRRYYKDRKEIQYKILKLKDVNVSIESFMYKVQGTMGDETSSFLNAPNSLIQKYYRYLNPMSNSNGVQFESVNGELDIFIPVKDEKSEQILYNVKHTLSSGQLNVLAISIFLAVNESQKVSKLNFIGIDDPVQNMDNVNRFSICDVLSQIDKQLIISSHDVEFVKLLVKKNQHIANDIQVFHLESPSLDEDRIRQITF